MSASLRISLVALLSVTAAGRLAAADLTPRVFAIKDVRLVASAGKAIPKATVVVRDGVIESAGPGAPIPPEAIVIDGAGKTAYPGLIDALAHEGYDPEQRKSELGDPAPAGTDANPQIATRPDNRKGLTPEFETRRALRADDKLGERWRKAGVTARLVAPDGGIVAGKSCLLGLNGRPPRSAVVLTPAALHVSFERVSGGVYPRALMGIIAHARQMLLDAGHYRRLKQAFERRGRKGKRPPFDPSLEALGEVLDRKLPVVFEADSRDEILQALAFAAEFKLQPFIYGGEDAWRVTGELKKAGAPVILRLDFDEPTDREKKMPARAQGELKQRREKRVGCAAALHRAGVRFAISAAGPTAEKAASKFGENVRKAIDAGLPAAAALRALTQTPAELFGVATQLGTVAPGRAANLVLTDGDMFEKETRIHAVFVDGVRFEYPQKGEKKSAKKDKPKKKEKAEPAADVATEIGEDRKPKLKTGGDVIVRNASIITAAEAGVRRDTDVLIRGGKVVKIGQNLPAAAGVTEIDAEGMFVMPGIIDSHSHFSIRGGVNEFSLSVVPEVRVLDVVDSDDIQIYRSLAGGVTTARLLHGSANVIGGQDAVIKLKCGATAGEMIVADGPRGVKFALGENVKRTSGRFPDSRLGVEAVLLRAFNEARAYKKTWEDYRQSLNSPEPLGEPRRDLRLEALVDILNGKIKVHCHCYRADEILMLLRVANKFGFKIQSLQHVLEGYKIAPEIADHGASSSLFSDWWAYKIEAYDAIPYAAALMDRAGAEVCLKSDSNELVRHMYQEAAKLIKYGGMSELKAIQAITLNAAKQLGLEDRIGSIEVGKDGDLAIFNGHPLNGFSRCEMTLVEGEVFFQRSKKLSPSPIAAAGPTKPAGDFPTVDIARDPSGQYFLKGVTVHTVTGGTVERATVAIKGGKVVRVAGPGAAASAESLQGTGIDAPGLHLYPGMVDAGTVLGLTELGSARETQDFREGGDFQPDLRASIAINPDSELIPVTRANGVLTALTRPTGSIVAGQAVLLNLDGWVPREMIVEDNLALQVELPRVSRLFRGASSRFATGLQRRQREDKIRRLKVLFEQAKRYAAARRAKPDMPVDTRLAALAPYAQGRKAVIMQAYRKADIEAALDLAKDLKLKIILSGASDSWKVTERLKEQDVPVILGPVMSLPAERHDPYDAPFACAAKLKDAGVKFCIRSEGDSNARNLPYEAAMAVSYGLSPAEGLKAVTLYPAQILGVADRLGSIEAGKTANLVLTNGDVLQPSTQVLAMFIDGEPLKPESKQTRLYQRYMRRLKEVKQGRAPLGTK